MREAFIEQKFRADSLEVIETANRICADYQSQGFNLTLRQLYYQFVARDLIPNNQRSYKRLGDIVNNARLAGLLDWSYISDRTRNVKGAFAGFANAGAFARSVMDADRYYENLWADQTWRPEVWVEKDALVDVVARAARTRRVPYFSCRGYVSQSEMYEAAKRMQRRHREGNIPIVIHLGDHDPSGIDMTRDIRERLALMSYEDVEVRRIALTMDQIRRYEPPPNFAKITDSRAEDYIAEYGEESWELDALEPQVLVDLIEETVDEYVDDDLWDDAAAVEDAEAIKVQAVGDRWTEIEQYLLDNPVE